MSHRYSLTDKDIFSSASAVSTVASFVNSTTLGKKDVNILQDNPPQFVLLIRFSYLQIVFVSESHLFQ